MDLLNFKSMGAGFGCLIDASFRELSLFGFKKKNVCSCENCKGTLLTPLQEVESFLFDEATNGKVTKEDVVTGHYFPLSFEEFCVLKTLISEKNPAPIEAMFAIALPNRDDIIEKCFSSPNLKGMAKELMEAVIQAEKGEMKIENILKLDAVRNAMPSKDAIKKILDELEKESDLLSEVLSGKGRGPLN